MDDKNFLDYEGLAYYNEKIKAYAKNKADQAESNAKSYTDDKIKTVYRYKGSVSAYSDLTAMDTSDFTGGETYNVESDNMNYAWVAPEGETAGHWDQLGSSFNIDTVTESQIDSLFEAD